MGLTRGITPSPSVPKEGIAGEGGKAMRKKLKLYHPFIRVEGLYCLEPSTSGKVLRMGDFQCFGDRHIVEVLSDEVLIKDLSGYLPLEEYGQEGDWARFSAYEGPEDPLELDLPFVADVPMRGVVLLEGCASGKRILVVLEEVWEDPDQFKEGSPFREFLLREGFAFLEPPSLNDAAILLGGDPEFEVVDILSGEVIPAREVDLFEEGGENPSSVVGTDGCSDIAEIRPRACETPEDYVREVRSILEFIKEKNPRIDLSVEGNNYPLGGHIHVGAKDAHVRETLQTNVRVFVEALDDFIGKILLPTSGSARGRYAVLSAYEEKPHGWEYRTPPASIYGDLEVLRITYKLVKGLVEKLLREGELSYYVGKDGIPPFEEYLAFLTEEEARYFLDFPRRWEEGEVCPLLLGTSGQFAH
jgi:hypothetical protein